MLRLNPGTGILDADRHPFVRHAETYSHLSARGSIPNGIVEQIDHRLLEPLDIAEHERRGLDLQGETNLMIFSEHAQFIDEFLEQTLEIEGRSADSRGARRTGVRSPASRVRVRSSRVNVTKRSTCSRLLIRASRYSSMVRALFKVTSKLACKTVKGVCISCAA
jgi:hypothetical protein